MAGRCHKPGGHHHQHRQERQAAMQAAIQASVEDSVRAQMVALRNELTASFTAADAAIRAEVAVVRERVDTQQVSIVQLESLPPNVPSSQGIQRLEAKQQEQDNELRKLRQQIQALEARPAAIKTMPVPPPFLSQKEAKGRRILCLDGGGIRGLSSLQYLIELESKLDQPLYQYFDLICGTSTGGIIALTLTQGVNQVGGGPLQPWTARECAAFYRQNASVIFPGGPVSDRWRLFNHISWGYYYSNEALRRVLSERFGDRAVNCDFGPKVFVVSKLLNEPSNPFLLRNYVVQESFAGQAFQSTTACALATSAAPTYFPDQHVNYQGQDVALLDGGVGHNNPALLAWTEAQSLWPDDRVELIVSVGTGEGNAPTTFGEHATAALTGTKYVHSLVYTMAKLNGIRYHRFNAKAPVGDCALDETRGDKLDQLIADSKRSRPI